MDLTRFADAYWDAKDDRVDRQRLELLAENVPSGAPVLVVDGGPGMLVELLLARGHEARMTDVSAAAVLRARKKGLLAEQLDTDDAPLPFGDGTFPCVISDSAIEHRYYPERAVGECVRVLSSGGTLLLLIPNIGHWRYRLSMLFGSFPEIKDAASDACHLRHFGLPQMRRLVMGHGLRVERVRGFQSLWVKGLYPRFLRAPGVRSVYAVLARLRPSLFARDILLVCRKP